MTCCPAARGRTTRQKKRQRRWEREREKERERERETGMPRRSVGWSVSAKDFCTSHLGRENSYRKIIQGGAIVLQPSFFRQRTVENVLPGTCKVAHFVNITCIFGRPSTRYFLLKHLVIFGVWQQPFCPFFLGKSSSALKKNKRSHHFLCEITAFYGARIPGMHTSHQGIQPTVEPLCPPRPRFRASTFTVR